MAIPVIDYVQKFSMAPTQVISDMDLEIETATTTDSIAARFLAVAQLIISLLALPIISIVGLISAACADKGKGKEVLENMVDYLKWHVLFAIPSAAVGIFAPLETTEQIAYDLLENFENNIIHQDRIDEQNKIVAQMLLPSGAMYAPQNGA